MRQNSPNSRIKSQNLPKSSKNTQRKTIYSIDAVNQLLYYPYRENDTKRK